MNKTDRETQPPPIKLKFYSPRRLAKKFPELHPPLVDGILRKNETMSIVSAPKVGKSWFAHGLGLAVATGNDWHGFETTKGRVLLIDGELAEPTLNFRLMRVAKAMGLELPQYSDNFSILPIRSTEYRLRDIVPELEARRGEFALVIVDPKYRFTDIGASENDNADETRLWAMVNRLAESMESAIALVHHTGKGTHGDKAVTDVGAGAGAQSRAADAHLVLREHRTRGVYVMEAVVRSFAPLDPVPLAWEFPLWVPADDVDATDLKGRLSKGDERQRRLDDEIDDALKARCDEWRSATELKKSSHYGIDRIRRALSRMVEKGDLRVKEDERSGHKCEVFRVVR